ncbi:MAG: hypothetical protein AB8B91_15750 [Rubripirellula sp.]
MIDLRACTLASALFLSLVVLSDSSYAESAPKSGAGATNGERRVTLTQTVEPSFHIEPIVHRFNARRGTTIPFRFEIKSTGKAMNVTAIPVKLRQEATGIILHDTKGLAPEEITFTSPAQFELAPGESKYIEGTLTVPLAKSNFLSFGVLVRDNGQASADAPQGDNPSQIKAGVRFVTQYVLRIDVETGVKDLSQMDHLVFEHGQVLNERGMPVAKTYLTNPTDFAFECAVRGTIRSSSTSRPKPFRMTLPSRVSLEGDERYLVRIMPKSRIVLSANVDSLLFPGKQTLLLEVTNGRRALVDQSFAVNVRPGDFPALETRLAYLDRELSVEPAQIEVGKISTSKRTCNLTFTNNSTNSKSVQIELKDLQGNALSGIRLSSSDVEVKPGRTKTVRASVQSSQASDQATYGVVQLKIQSGETATTRELPLAALFASPPSPSVRVGELESVEKAGHTSFRLLVTNEGEGYAPVHADLQIAKETGHALLLADGFGRWLKPGESRELAFMPRESLPAGSYQVSLNLQTSPEQEPVTQTLNIQLSPEATKSVATDSPKAAQAG